MKSSIPAATKADKERFAKLQAYGCVCCRDAVQMYAAPDIHHILHAGKRVSHQHTIPLCPYHHRGIVEEGIGYGRTAIMLGPSMALAKKAFIQRFGTEAELLQRVNEAIA